jgi:hypothetical protein
MERLGAQSFHGKLKAIDGQANDLGAALSDMSLDLDGAVTDVGFKLHF